MSQILKYLVLALGEALIIAGFILLAPATTTNILVLNIIVATLVYGLLCSFMFVPMVDLNDKTQKAVGGLGIRFKSITTYAFLAIIVMLIGYVYDVQFKYQLIGQLVALFILLLYMMAGSAATKKTEEVYHEEKAKQGGVKAMRSATTRLNNLIAETPGLPLAVTNGARDLGEELSYISPNADMEAKELEAQYVEAVEDMGRALRFYDQEPERVNQLLARARRVLAQRKAYLS